MASIQSPAFGVPYRQVPYVAPRRRPATGTMRDAEIDRVRALARVLDSFFLDPILGLIIPGGGDILGSLLGIYTVVIARMLMNLAADALLGFIPIVGDLFDFGFKANQKNVELLTQRDEHDGKATARDWLILIGAVSAFLAVIALVVYGIVALVRAIA